MKVSKSELVDLFVELGYAEAKGWSPSRLGKKVPQLKTLPEDTEIEDPRSKELFDSIIETLEGGGEIEIEGEEAPAPRKGKKSAPEKNGKPEKTKPAKPKAETDKLGNRVGTRAAAINAVLTKKPQTMKDLRAQLPEVKAIDSHLRYLQLKGLVEKVDDGYKLAK